MSRAASKYRVFYVEEPVVSEEPDRYSIRPVQENLWVVTPHLSHRRGDDPGTALSGALDELMQEFSINDYITWYYTPMMLPATAALKPKVTIYDCMDELSNFKFADPIIRLNEKMLFDRADVVFTGGTSLYNLKKEKHRNVSCFPSSIDFGHFASARTSNEEPEDMAAIPHPRLGYCGVVDERFDIPMLTEAAAKRPDLNFVIIGPVVKIDPETLPKASNIHYLGMKKYDELPSYLGALDIAVLLFAINDATRYISPTKTPEYLAAGKPVISTRIADVVIPYADLGFVKIADTADQLIEATDHYLHHVPDTIWKKRRDSFLQQSSWDDTWRRMSSIIDKALIPTNKKSLNYV